MGTCYSKSGHELETSNRDKRPKERKKGSQKNGHINSNHKPLLIVEDFDSIQKDVSDTVYTEDSHTFNGLEVDNLLHKSQQTSLDMLAKDTNRNSDTLTACDSSEPGDINNSSKDINNDCDEPFQIIEQKDVRDDEIVDKVVTSDSGVVLESEGITNPEQSIILKCEHVNKTETTPSNIPTNLKDVQTKVQGIHTNCSHTNSGVNDSKAHVNSQTEHSSCSCYHDLDKLKLAVRQSACSTPADQWSLSESLDASYDLPSVHSQPIRTMHMNGRDVVVMDQELFSQIMDEVQFLKMKLSQLTDVIQESEAGDSVIEGPLLSSTS